MRQGCFDRRLSLSDKTEPDLTHSQESFRTPERGGLGESRFELFGGSLVISLRESDHPETCPRIDVAGVQAQQRLKLLFSDIRMIRLNSRLSTARVPGDFSFVRLPGSQHRQSNDQSGNTDKPQKVTCTPNSMTRIGCCKLVIRPADDESTLEFGSLRFLLFHALKASARTSTAVLSRLRFELNLNSFESDQSAFTNPGPRSIPGDASPNWQQAGILNAAGLYHSADDWPPATADGETPDTRFGRCPKSPLRLAALDTEGVNAKPDCTLVIPL